MFLCLPVTHFVSFAHSAFRVLSYRVLLHMTFNPFKFCFISFINPLMPNDPYKGRTAPLTSRRCILYIYSTNTGTEYFKHGIYSPFFPLQNAVCFIILTYLVPVLFIFYTQCALKLKKKKKKIWCQKVNASLILSLYNL